MKNWLCLVLCTLLLLHVGCAALPKDAPVDTPVSTTTTTTTAAPTTTVAPTTTTTTTEVPTKPTTTTTAPAFISQEQAVEIAEQYWDIRTGDRDPGTGFMMTVGPMVLPTAETPEYVIALRWLVEVDGQPSHFSMVDSIRIDAVSGEVLPITLYPEQ